MRRQHAYNYTILCVRAKLNAPAWFPQILDQLSGGAFPHIMVDSNGSQFFRALVSFCDDRQRTHILLDTQAHIARIACTRFGSWAVQALLDQVGSRVHIHGLYDL